MTAPATGSSAGAILLSLVGEDEASALIGQLGPDEITALCAEMTSLATVGESEIEAVLTDFIAHARARNAVASAGSKPLRAAIERSLGPGRAKAMLGATPDEHPVFAQLAWLTDEGVAEIIAVEHPQVAAIVLGRVPPQRAALALATLPEDDQVDLLHRLATLGPVGTDALDALARVVAARIDVPGVTRVDVGGSARVAAILNRAARPVADKTIRALSKIDKSLARSIDNERVTFADVIGLADRDLGTVVRSIDAAVLARALKGLDEPVRDRFLAAMSARAAQSLRDEIEELVSLSRAEVEAAQAAVVSIARSLGDDGAVRLGAEVSDYV